MPHVVIQYTGNIETLADMNGLCHKIAATLVAQRDDAGKAVFPTAGTRVLAYPAPFHAVADGQKDYAFVYVNVRIAPGRSDASKKAAGDTLLAVIQEHFKMIFAEGLIGITLQIDESPQQVYDAKHSNLHPLFKK